MKASRANDADFAPNICPYSEIKVHLHHCGNMEFAQENMFLQKKTPDGHFNKFLSDGKKFYVPTEENFQHIQSHCCLFEIITQGNIRSYNSSLPFSSIADEVQNPPRKGIFCLCMHGEIHHRTARIHSTEGKRIE